MTEGLNCVVCLNVFPLLRRGPSEIVIYNGQSLCSDHYFDLVGHGDIKIERYMLLERRKRDG